MHFELLADRPEAIPIVARWYFDEWCREAGHAYEEICQRIGAPRERDQLPIVVLAVEGAFVVGVAELKPHEMQSLYPGRSPWLGGVFVRPESRGQGIASALAARIVEIAAQGGHERIFLQTTALDGGLYARLGWQPLEQVHYRGLDVLVMAKRLGQAESRR